VHLNSTETYSGTSYYWEMDEIMDVARILGYEDSPNFLRADEDFPHAQELAYVLRKARTECGLKGVYVLREQNDTASPIPVLYFLSGQYGSRSTVDSQACLEPGNCSLCSG
jgi:hypothetical protein